MGDELRDCRTRGKATSDAFVEIIRRELRRRGVDGPGVASITVENNHAVLHWLWQGRACSVSLDRHFDRYMDGFDYQSGLGEALDRAFFEGDHG